MLEDESDRASMADIYNTHKSVMLRYALSILQNKEMAEDAVHNAFLAIIKHKEKHFSMSSRELRTHLVIITKNKCIDLLRKQTSFGYDQIDDIGDSIDSGDIPVEDQVVLKDEYESIKKHIKSLDEISKLVLEMKYILGMTYREIGENLGITPKHVDTRIQRAKEKVRKLIARGGETDEL